MNRLFVTLKKLSKSRAEKDKKVKAQWRIISEKWKSRAFKLAQLITELKSDYSKNEKPYKFKEEEAGKICFLSVLLQEKIP